MKPITFWIWINEGIQPETWPPKRSKRSKTAKKKMGPTAAMVVGHLGLLVILYSV